MKNNLPVFKPAIIAFLVIVGFVTACSSKAGQPIPGNLMDSPQPLTSSPFSPTAPATTPLSSEQCRSVDLKATFGGSHDNNHSITQVALFTNTRDTPCLLPFFPDIVLLDNGGEPLPVRYTFFKEPVPSTYLLADPGQQVGFLVVWTNWCQVPLSRGVTIRLRLPDETFPIDIPTEDAGGDIQPVNGGGRCTDAAQESQVSISQFQFGIPDILGP